MKVSLLDDLRLAAYLTHYSHDMQAPRVLTEEEKAISAELMREASNRLLVNMGFQAVSY